MFKLNIVYTLVGTTYLSEDNIILHLSNDTMQDILAELSQKMNTWITENISPFFQNNFSFSLTLIDESYIMIQWNNYNSGTFKLKLVGNFSNTYFSFQSSDYENIDENGYVTLNNSTPNVVLYPAAVDGSDVNVYTPLPNYDLRSLYFHWDISNDINNYICEVNMIGEHKYMREYELNNMKTFKINTMKYGYIEINEEEEEKAVIEEGTTKIKFWFTYDGVTKLHI
jgi:hypothetical protein